MIAIVDVSGPVDDYASNFRVAASFLKCLNELDALRSRFHTGVHLHGPLLLDRSTRFPPDSWRLSKASVWMASFGLVLYFHNTCWHRRSLSLSLCVRFNVIRPRGSSRRSLELSRVQMFFCKCFFTPRSHSLVMVMSLRLILTWFPWSRLAVCISHQPQQVPIYIHEAFLFDLGFFYSVFYFIVLLDIRKTDSCAPRRILVLDLKVRCRQIFKLYIM